MKIAFFTPTPFDKKYGAAKNRIELADALTLRGNETFLIGNKDLGLQEGKMVTGEKYCFALKDYLIKNANLFDIILYEYDTLPFERELFSSSTVFIARPALVYYHFDQIHIPVDLKTKISRILRKFKFLGNNKIKSSTERNIVSKSLSNADVIQVQNTMDKKLLLNKFPQKNVILVPNGIGEDRFWKFQNVKRSFNDFSDFPKIAFVGTFDYRKGAIDFKYIVKEIVKIKPNVEFHFLGSLGLFTTEKAILKFFPAELRNNIKVIPHFKPDDLPSLLSKCHIGLFPSYLESFGFGALEMMCSGLPVLAYNCPGPCDFILEELLFEVGSKEKLTSKLAQLIQNRAEVEKYSSEARELSKNYRWINISEKVENLYKNLIKTKI